MASGVLAQGPASLRARVFAIRDARVIVFPGHAIESATIVVRNGLIEDVGADVKAPPDAIVIDGKGMTVYPGFIDATSNWGFDPALRRNLGGPPATEDFASEALAATKPDNRKGLTPEFTVASALRDEEQAANWRKLGFTAHLVAPEGGMLTGQSALVSLSGLPSRETVIRSAVAQHGAFRPVAGADYPRSRMGEVAHVRQFFLDAGYNQRQWRAFEANGMSGRQPPQDAALAALIPVLDQKQPLIFEADTADAIQRVLDFADEFHLRPIIFGGRDAWKVAATLKSRNVPVILRLVFEEPNQDREKDLPQRVRDDRRYKERQEQLNALALYKAGVKFSFSTAGQTSDKPWDKFHDNLVKAIALGLPADAALAALTTDAAEILGVASQLGRIEKGRPAHLVLMNGKFENASTQVRDLIADGVRFEFETKLADAKDKPADAAKGSSDKAKSADTAKASDAKSKPADSAKPVEVKTVEPQGEGRDSEVDRDRQLMPSDGKLLIRGATILPVTGPPITSGDIEIVDGKIAYVGPKRDSEWKGTTIDATGLFVMPGIIDTHSHFSIEGGVNEFSLSIVPEVRVRDVVDSEDIQIYRALAGGVTTARLLHGSANCIGGQDAVIKLKYGTSAKEMVIADAPRGVKFALGENVKRTDGRFPNTRLGVEAVLIRAFSEAQAYRKQWEDYQKDPKHLPEPRRDLRLEALADILKGDLHIHCHCYREDEILMLLRVADRFGFKIKSLQHVLEGYKVAPEIAAHGASCSLFSDWWAYKVEAYDAIPFAAALLHEAGASICLKSDSHELMRHLYQEAAKVVKYGGLSEAEALKTITLNAAKQLGLEKRIGSIEVGKDADLAIFSGHPLNSYSRVEMTIVEGKVYFHHSDKLRAVEAAAVPPAAPVAHFNAIPNASQGRYVLLGGTVHGPDGKPLDVDGIVIEGGKIAHLIERGKPYGQSGPGPIHLDRNVHIYPGMIDAGTVLGLIELGSLKETQDYQEGGDFQPDLRASTGVNPDSELIPVTRANGVLTVVTRPMGGLLAGQSAVLNLAGWTPHDMSVLDPFALHIDLPAVGGGRGGFMLSDPNTPFSGRGIEKRQRDEKIRRLKELFKQAAAYSEARSLGSGSALDPRLEALLPYLHGEKPVVIFAQKKAEIQEAIKLADDLKLKVILSGAIDAWKVAPELKKRDIPVIVGPIMAMPSESYDPYDGPFACIARLQKEGVRFCIRSGGSSNTRNLPYEAAMAVSYGLPPEEGLKAVTLYPAQILGLEKQLGSIEVGKRANLVLTNGDLLQASTQVLSLFIDGKPYEPTSKQTRLYEKYRERLKDVKEGRATLGTK
jgi:imidazolonepropionase-like amidohydrolase